MRHQVALVGMVRCTNACQRDALTNLILSFYQGEEFASESARNTENSCFPAVKKSSTYAIGLFGAPAHNIADALQ
jgi:hypothetical protein